MIKVSTARLRHHSLTCFSQTVAKNTYSLSIAKRIRRNPIERSYTRLAASTFTPSSARVASTIHNLKMDAMHSNGAAKRKQHPSLVEGRPQKQHRAINGKESAGENTPEVGSVFEDDMEMEEPRILPAAMADSAEWQATIEKVVRNVVSIRFCQTCSFDTDPALTSEATGFVVDAERG
jgi:hypothetical protein